MSERISTESTNADDYPVQNVVRVSKRHVVAAAVITTVILVALFVAIF